MLWFVWCYYVSQHVLLKGFLRPHPKPNRKSGIFHCNFGSFYEGHFSSWKQKVAQYARVVHLDPVFLFSLIKNLSGLEKLTLKKHQFSQGDKKGERNLESLLWRQRVEEFNPWKVEELWVFTPQPWCKIQCLVLKHNLILIQIYWDKIRLNPKNRINWNNRINSVRGGRKVPSIQ